jgi:glutaredoxin
MEEIKVTLYTTEDCSKCKMLKQLLDAKHITYRELNAIDNRDSIKDSWFISAPIIKFEREWEATMRFEDMQDFINYLNENWIGIA